MKRPLLSHLDDQGCARMVDVSAKPATLRSARARAEVILGRSLASRLRRTGRVGKGNVIETARLAGIQGATGLFARVLSDGPAARGDAVVVEARIPRSTFQVVVLTLSDRCAGGIAQDKAGPAVADLLHEALEAHLYRSEILPDVREPLAERLRHYADGHGIDLVVAVGGTGFSPRDVTPEAVRDVIDRPTPGLDEAMRAASLATSPFAMLSRACSGIRGQTLIVSLPGSERAALECLRVFSAALPHGLAKLRGDPSDCGRVVP